MAGLPVPVVGLFNLSPTESLYWEHPSLTSLTRRTAFNIMIRRRTPSDTLQNPVPVGQEQTMKNGKETLNSVSVY